MVHTRLKTEDLLAGYFRSGLYLHDRHCGDFVLSRETILLETGSMQQSSPSRRILFYSGVVSANQWCCNERCLPLRLAGTVTRFQVCEVLDFCIFVLVHSFVSSSLYLGNLLIVVSISLHDVAS